MRLSPVVQSLTEPLLSPLVSAITGVFGGGYSPVSLFVDGSKGVFYDNNDFVNPSTWRRNLLTYSEQFDNAAWLKQATGTGVIPVVTPNFGVAPDGTTTADRIVFDLGATPASAYSRVGQFNLTTNTSIRSKSVWLKTTDGTTKTLYFQGPQTGNTALTVTGEWTRFSVSDSTPAVSAYAQMQFGLDSTTSTTASVLAWGAQVEENAPTATTYQRITNFNSDFLAAFPNTTMFVDAAGTTPATVNGLVGLQLDKSANLALGAEIKSSGVIGLVGTATAATYNTSTGVGTVTRVDASNQSFVQWSGLSANAFYKVTLQNTGSSGQNINVRSGDQGAATAFTVNFGTTVTGYAQANAVGLITVTAAGPVTVPFTIQSFALLTGNHRYQTTSGSRPILRGTPTGANIVTNGDFSSATGWVLNSGWAISGGLATKTAGTPNTMYQLYSLVVGRTYRLTYTVSGRTAGTCAGFLGSGTTVAGPLLGTNGTRVEYLTAVTGNAYYGITADSTFDGSIDNFQVFDVTSDVVTAPYGLQYDGVDDFMQTAAINFTATDKMFVCAGVRKLSDAATGVVSSLGDLGATNGSYEFRAPWNAATANIGLGMRGNAGATSGATYTTFTAPVTKVYSFALDYALGANAEISARADGVGLTPAGTDSGAGPFANAIMYFGRRAGVSLPYNGLDFGFVIVGKTLTATQISQTERFIAQRTGVTL